MILSRILRALGCHILRRGGRLLLAGDGYFVYRDWNIVKFRRNRFWTGDLRRGTEDLPKVRVQGIDPDFFARADLAVVFFQFAATLGLSEPDPISRPVGDRKSVV